jgi:hypothetical protein
VVYGNLLIIREVLSRRAGPAVEDAVVSERVGRGRDILENLPGRTDGAGLDTTVEGGAGGLVRVVGTLRTDAALPRTDAAVCALRANEAVVGRIMEERVGGVIGEEGTGGAGVLAILGAAVG